MIIGRGSKDNNNSWNGLVDDVRLYNKVLSDNEITNLPFVTNRSKHFHGVALTGVADFTTDTTEAMLSETSLHLDAGASTDVTLTFSTDVLTMMLSTPDEYVVTVTATSENVSTETAKIKSTITKKFIPGDLTDDGVVNILDLVKVASQFGETQMDYAVANISISHE